MKELYIFRKIEGQKQKIINSLDNVNELKRRETATTNILNSLMDKLITYNNEIEKNKSEMESIISTLNNEFSVEIYEKDKWEFNKNEVLKMLEREQIETKDLNELKNIFLVRKNKITINGEIREHNLLELENSYIYENRDYINNSIEKFNYLYELILEDLEKSRLVVNNINIIVNTFSKKNRKEILQIRKYFTKRIKDLLIENEKAIKKVEFINSYLSFKTNGEFVSATQEQKQDMRNINEWKKSIYGGRRFLAASQGNIIKDHMDTVMEQIVQTYINYITLNKSNKILLNTNKEKDEVIKLDKNDIKSIIKNIELDKNGEWKKVETKFTIPKLEGKYDFKEFDR